MKTEYDVNSLKFFYWNKENKNKNQMITRISGFEFNEFSAARSL